MRTIATQEIVNQMKQNGPIGLNAVDLRWAIFESMEDAGLIARLPFPWLEEMPAPGTDPKTFFAAVRSDEEIAELKHQWQSDPCWDIEETEGFELYRVELLGYSIVKEKEWAASYQKRLEQKAQMRQSRRKTLAAIASGAGCRRARRAARGRIRDTRRWVGTVFPTP